MITSTPKRPVSHSIPASHSKLNIMSSVTKRHGTQVGDPAKGARAMYDLAVMQDPPLRCIVGSDAYEAINAKLEAYQESVKKFEKLSLSTDVDK